MEARQASQPSYPFQLSLRVRHPSIDPAAISRELQIEPEHSFRAGDLRDSTRSAAVTPAQAIALAAVDSALTILITSVLRRHAEFFRRIESEGGEVRLIVALSARKTRGFTLTPHLCKALSELRVPVDFELAHR
jgi:hypothetical protein